MNKIFSFVIVGIVAVSCNNSSSGRADTEIELPENNAPAGTVNTPSTPVEGNQPVILNAPANQATPAANTTTPAQGNVALNPKHGMPGHRCDIPEGAPLNSAPANTATPVVQSTPVVNNPQPAQPATGKLKINPAHGEPGHDCTVPVGQPLKN